MAAAHSLLLITCGSQALDAGSDVGLLPVHAHNPVIVNNDNYDDNWQGVYAVLFANAGRPTLAGIIINDSVYAPDIDNSITAWRALVTAGRASGMRNLPDPIVSQGRPLVRPSDGNIDSTVSNHSPGAQLIVETSGRLGLPQRPLVVATGGRLTDVADAYLVDHSVQDRVVVVSSLGSVSGNGGVMGAPNGEIDPWADWIVAQRFTYVQVSAFYDQTTDVPSSQLDSLPKNAFGEFVAAQQPIIENIPTRDDHVAIIAVGEPEFVVSVQRMALDPAGTFETSVGPKLVPDANGHVWLVTAVDGAAATPTSVADAAGPQDLRRIGRTVMAGRRRS